MAISDNYNSLTFGGINSLDYGIYISGPGVYNAPTRAVEFVDVPGRNGAIEIDQGHWNNIEVTYEAGMFADDQADFGERMNEFRNAIVSQTGYQRLTDTYNPEHNRLGVYASGIEVNPVRYNDAGEFTLVFNCKPQRYLTSGDTEVTVASGGTITNPTLYEASPLLKVYFDPNHISTEGTESVTLASGDESYTAEFKMGPMGPTTLVEDGNYGPDDIDSLRRHACFYPMAIHKLIAPDDIYTIDGLVYESYWSTKKSNSDYSISGVVGKSTGPYTITTRVEDVDGFDLRRVYIQTKFDPVSFPQQEDGQAGGKTFDLYVDIAIGSPAKVVVRVFPKYSMYVRRLAWTYYNIIDFKYATHDNPQVISGDAAYMRDLQGGSRKETIHFDLLSVDLTAPIQGDPTYIDTEIGEAYKIVGGYYFELNKYVSLGSDLPKLFKGNTSVTCSSHIKDLQLKMNPRWWEL